MEFNTTLTAQTMLNEKLEINCFWKSSDEYLWIATRDGWITSGRVCSNLRHIWTEMEGKGNEWCLLLGVECSILYYFP